MMDLKVTLPAETEGSLPGSIILTEVLQEPARSARSLWFSLSLASSIICFIISASFGEAVVVAGAEMTGLVTVVGGALGCGAGVCADAMEAIKAIATRAISAEIMRVFMRMILLAGSMASNKKAKREASRASVIGCRLLDCARRRGEVRGPSSVLDGEKQAFFVTIGRCMSQEFRPQGRHRGLLSNFRCCWG